MIRIQQILAPTDFSDDSKIAARYARELAAKYEAEVHCLHISDVPADLLATSTYYMTGPSEEFIDQLRAESQENLDKFVDEHYKGVSAQSMFSEGKPWLQICEYVKKHDIDVVVIATHGRTGLKHVLFGSTAEKVVRRAACPVLVVKAGEHDFVTD